MFKRNRLLREAREIFKHIELSDNSRTFLVKIYDVDPFGNKGDFLSVFSYRKNKDAQLLKKALKLSTSKFKIEIDRIDTEDGYIKEKI